MSLDTVGQTMQGPDQGVPIARQIGLGRLPKGPGRAADTHVGCIKFDQRTP